MIEKILDGFRVFTFEKLRKDRKIFCCVFSKFANGKTDADFSLSKLGSDKKFKSFLKSRGANSLFLPLQRHTANVYTVRDYSHQSSENFDASCSNLPGKALAGFSADCSVSLFYDRKNRAIGICHAGWKGALLDIYSNLFKTMSLNYGTRPQDLFVGVGPFISQANYPVKEELIEKFRSFYGRAAKKFYYESEGVIRFSLEKVLRFQLKELGIKDFEFSGFCTFDDNELFHSHRRNDKGRFAMLAFLRR
ncbi:MAG: hypothetical protein Fur0012_09520 [Elusimicrobiota bacterium]